MVASFWYRCCLTGDVFFCRLSIFLDNILASWITFWRSSAVGKPHTQVSQLAVVLVCAENTPSQLQNLRGWQKLTKLGFSFQKAIRSHLNHIETIKPILMFIRKEEQMILFTHSTSSGCFNNASNTSIGIDASTRCNKNRVQSKCCGKKIELNIYIN